ncbi:hypothetical protein QKW52_28510 [Bacillus sonorensis]|nr:hypothetical protein [Bacillus sonorensis]
MTMPGVNGELLSARQIRSYHHLNFDHLGIVLIVADLKSIVGDLPQDWGKAQARLPCRMERNYFFRKPFEKNGRSPIILR